MSRTVIVNNVYVSRQRQRVYVNGSYRRDIYASDITVTAGKQATTASFILPSKTFADDLSRLDDAEVIVYTFSQGGRQRSNPIFRGYLEAKTAKYNTQIDSQTIKARGAYHRLKRVYVGKHAGVGEVIYRKADGWRLDTIVRDLFSGTQLSAAYRSIIGLGDLSGLRQASYEMQTMPFPGTPYIDALWSIVQLAGNVRIRERFTGSKTLLDFVTIGDSEAPVRRIITPRRGVGPNQGAITTDLQDASNVEEIVNQVDAIGAPIQTMLTVRTQTETTDAPMIPAWPSYTPYTVSELTSNENSVLSNPGYATPGHPSYSETDSKRFVFRRFLLPDALSEFDIHAVNAWRNSNNERIKVQAFIEDYAKSSYQLHPNDPTIDKRTDGTKQYRLVNAEILEGYVLLAEPAVRIYSYDVDIINNESVIVRERAPVFITITVSRRDQRSIYSTGVRGNLQFPTISSSGITLPILNETARYERVGTGEDGLTDGRFSYSFGAIWFDDVTGIWSVVDPESTPVIVRDDRAFLRSIANRSLAERSQRRAIGTRRIPRVHQGYRLLDRVRMGKKTLQIIKISYSLLDPETVIEATDALPDTMNVDRMKAPGADKATPNKNAEFGAMASALGNVIGAFMNRRKYKSLKDENGEFHAGQMDPFDATNLQEWIKDQGPENPIPIVEKPKPTPAEIELLNMVRGGNNEFK